MSPSTPARASIAARLALSCAVALASAACGGGGGGGQTPPPAATLQTVEVAPGTPSIAKGRTQAFTATGRYDDGSTQDLTGLATWASSTGAATMSGAVATGAAAGQTAITASYAGRSGAATLTVTAAELDAIAVAPGALSIPEGLTASLVATGTYSDGTTADVTATAAWGSDDLLAASVVAGVVTAVGQGEATVTASLGGRSGTAAVSVTAAALQGLALSPSSVSIPKGRSQQVVATGSYSNGTQQDLTVLAVWSSASPAVATVDAGLASGADLGTTTIAASLDGQTGTASVAVTAPVLDSLSVAPADPTLAKGFTLAFTATGRYSDGSTQDVTALATWASSATAVATMAGAVATGVAEGTSTISAAFGGKSGETALTVTAVTLRSVSVAPPAPSVAKGLTRAFTATATWSDGSTTDTTAVAAWTTSDPTIATMAGPVATGVAEGQATVTATYAGQSGTATLTVTAPVIRSLAVSPGSATIAKGLTATFAATATLSDGTTADVTADAAWTTDAPAVATATGNVVQAMAEGSTQVHAATQGLTASADVTVTPAVVADLTLSPAAATLAAGTSLPYGAVAVYTDGSKQDVTAAATWVATPAGVASITAAGVATGVAPGAATVAASYAGLSAQAPLTVTDAILASLALSPSDPTVALGIPQAFNAIGIFSDGTMQDLTGQVSWTASPQNVATISSAGVATPVSAGTATITATQGAVSASTALTVTSATLSSLSVDPASATLAAGTTAQLTATALYSDGTTVDVTAAATWSTSDAAVATVSNHAGTQGSALGVAAGAATITASFGGQTDTAALTVTSAFLVSVTVGPSPVSLPLGMTQALTATGTFSDGTTQDLTAAAGWTSSDPSVAAVSNAPGEEGLATAIAVGTAAVTAEYDGVSGIASVTVTNAALVGIDVAPASTTLPVGYTQPFRATGRYSDQSTRDLTAQVTWQSSNTSVATISNAAGTQGLATGLAASATPVQIRATLAAVTGTASLTVTNASLQTIAVTPNPFTVQRRGTLQLTATGTFTDGSVRDITTACTWSSTNRGVAKVSKAGLVTGVGAGSVTIQAKKKNRSGTAAGTVT